MKGRRESDRLAGAIIVGCTVLALAMGGLAVATSRQHSSTTVQSDGNMARAARGTTAVILDKTDALTDRERSGLTLRLRNVARQDLRAGERLSLWTLGNHEDGTLSKEFCRCSPGFGGLGITDNPRMIRARFEATFGGPLDTLLDDVTRRETAPRSPIMEAVREVGELREFTDVTGPRRLLVVSDMLQNSEAWSQYAGRASFASLSRSPAWRDLDAALRGVSVEIVYLHRPRDARFQGAPHRRFWREYFLACGAESVTFSRL
jgi:hypothetical protein